MSIFSRDGRSPCELCRRKHQYRYYHTTGPVVYVNETNALTGKDVTYNSKTSSMNMDNIEGFIGPTTYIRGTDAEMYDNIGYVKHGLITTLMPSPRRRTITLPVTISAFIPAKSLRLKIQRCGLSTSACLRMAITKAASIIGRIRGLIFSPCCPVRPITVTMVLASEAMRHTPQ